MPALCRTRRKTNPAVSGIFAKSRISNIRNNTNIQFYAHRRSFSLVSLFGVVAVEMRRVSAAPKAEADWHFHQNCSSTKTFVCLKHELHMWQGITKLVFFMKTSKLTDTYKICIIKVRMQGFQPFWRLQITYSWHENKLYKIAILSWHIWSKYVDRGVSEVWSKTTFLQFFWTSLSVLL